ncbi:hypothetical protein N7532_008941 [Penicillium argentinense]|uniref:HPt domain-containing protein n=1 Tax=Penicillium argentinense TaxID=1131581 RepID=A0A9W9K301_9EURO|nr:uncharacterized protein N7532_008941 [Penicillium argentinense]KAJ5090257.1 hypothetical protein N7532_008941 [Penicillium argentinense]
MAPMDPKKAEQPAGPPKLSDVKELIDESTFDQILEMDDDDDRDFSKGIVYGFFDQAQTTFTKIEKAIEEKKLEELSQLGHFLKGSSATLGLTNVKDGCEKIQHFGAGKDESGTADEPDESVSLKNIDKTLKEVKVEYAKVEKFLRRFYGEEVKEEPVPKEEKDVEKKDEEKKEKESENKQDKKEEKKEEKKDDSKK